MHASQEDQPKIRRRRQPSTRGPDASPSRPRVDHPDQTALERLIITGWVVALAYFPSGLLHGVAANLVYGRDVALGVHLIFSIGWLVRKRQFGRALHHGWFLLLTPLLLLPACFNATYVVEALRVCKWSLCWLDWILLGYFAGLNRQWGDKFKLMAVLTALMMVAELLAGTYEWITGDFLIHSEWGSRTAFGVISGWDQRVGGHIRIRGLQRDVFSFSNIMAMNAVAALAYLTVLRKAAYQWGVVIWMVACTVMMAVSGGRASIFGVVAASLYAVGLFTLPKPTVRFERLYVLLWVAIAITLSLVGVGRFTDFVGSTLLGGSYVGDSESAFMRDDYWTKMMGNFIHEPIILLTGGPFASLIDRRVDPIFHWVDNEILWDVYHLGIAGFLATAFFFYMALQPVAQTQEQRRVRQALILFLLFVIGEGIARESLTYMGCLPLFLLCGYDRATAIVANRSVSSASPFRRVSRKAGGSSDGAVAASL